VYRTYLNQNSFRKVTKLVNARVVRANVVYTENHEIVISEEFPPINSVETEILKFENAYYINPSKNSKIIFLPRGCYAFSRKEELFYHAINWVLPKIIELGFFDPNNLNPATLIINETLHWRVKDFLYQINSNLANNWSIIEVCRKEIYIIDELSIVSTLQGGSSQSSFLQIEHTKLLSASQVSNLIKYEYLYVKRGQDARIQDFRNLINAADLENLLNRKGFTSIDLAEYSLSKQIDIISNAKIVVGLHGGNFSLLPFAVNNNPVLLEIFCGLISDCFELQCAQLKIEYFKVNAVKTAKGFVLEIDEFSKILNDVLSK
jgi:hypothetical protein